MFDVLALQILSKLADGCTISQAADQLGYTQSGISKSIKRLEMRLGFTLVRPKGRISELSEEGRILGIRAQEVLGRIEEMEQVAYSLGRMRSHEVRVAAFPSAAAALLPAALADLGRKAPEVRMIVTHAHPKSATRMLRNGQTDIALIFRYALEGRNEKVADVARPDTQRIGASQVLVAMHKDHPLSRETAVPLSLLSEEAWVVAAENNRHHLVELFRAASITPHIAHEVDDYVVGLNHVAGGLGVALVPKIIIDLVRSPNIVTKRIEPATVMEIELEIGALSNRQTAIHQVVQAIQDAAEQHLNSAPDVVKP